MTEKQQEIYLETKARLRRMGKENPADVIVALAEEVDHYRDKIRSMEEFIAKKRGNETGLVAELRNKQSRDNRELLDRAADRIEELEAGYRKQEWISVDERLPEENGRYLVFVDISHFAFENLTAIAIMGYGINHGFYLYNETEKVTHWMPLPEPPKMKGGAE